ncbi:MAG: hypothetical protein H6918_05075 [Sphingomonadaceae bacterium]|nr:hypothetical protein [Sphingomonadaceae bacterium]
MEHLRYCAALTLASALVTQPVQADTVEELDAMVDASWDEQGAIRSAQGLAAQGEYLEALATLERFLALNPKSKSAQLLHASYLCRADDQVGGAVEASKLKKKDYPAEDWAGWLAPCTMVERD